MLRGSCPCAQPSTRRAGTPGVANEPRYLTLATLTTSDPYFGYTYYGYTHYGYTNYGYTYVATLTMAATMATLTVATLAIGYTYY